MKSGRSARSEWLVLAVVLAGAFMAILDVAIVNVAIPSIRSDLHAGFGAVGLVVTAYTIAYACLLVTGGRLGDLFGRKRLFIAGLVVFSSASALCGAAPSIGVLIAARALQGAGGAMLYPQVLAIIQLGFEGEKRARALGTFGAVIGLAAIAGQLIGGLLIDANVFGLDWRPVFLVNVPVGVLAAAAALAFLPDDRPQDRPGLDAGGVTLTAVTVLLLVVPLLEGRDQGWPAWMVACLVLSVPAGLAFVAYEARVARRGGRPLLRPDLFRNPRFASGVPIAAFFMASYGGFLIVQAVYLQVGLGFTPLQAGLTYAPSAVGFFLASLGAPRLVPLLGRSVLTAGYLIAALGLLGTAATASAAGGSVSGFELAPTLFIAGVGQGLGLTPLVGTIIAGLAPEDAGAGSGVITTTMQIGNALGVAVITLVFFTILGDAHSGGHYASAFAATLPVSAGLLVAAAVLVQRLPRGVGQPANALIERIPGWAGGFAYSMFLATGGRIGDALFRDALSHVAERRVARTEEAPLEPGEFLAFHFDEAAQDQAWLNYLVREGLAYGDREVPHERERLPVIERQVDEIRRRQEAGLLPPDLDPRLLRLLGFAVVSYPRMLPQVTRMTTGWNPGDPAFVREWEGFLRSVGRLFEAGAAPGSAAPGGSAPPSGSAAPGSSAPPSNG